MASSVAPSAAVSVSNGSRVSLCERVDRHGGRRASNAHALEHIAASDEDIVGVIHAALLSEGTEGTEGTG